LGHWDFAEELAPAEKTPLRHGKIATTLTAGGVGDWMELHVDKSNHKSLYFCTREILRFSAKKYKAILLISFSGKYAIHFSSC